MFHIILSSKCECGRVSLNEVRTIYQNNHLPKFLVMGKRMGLVYVHGLL
jgi:hypothetical protein